MTYLDIAIDALGGNTPLAAAIGVSVSTVGMWKVRGGGKVPAEYCPAIERATRARNADDSARPIVTCEQLRPDIDWSVVRNNPPLEEVAVDGDAVEPAEAAQAGEGIDVATEGQAHA
ncbi:MAG: transcriptional regulator [Dokdonella sp.]|uniref:transcriptional regulator n=1 Tax=Dokdonella sp. TaxID=2291710 RepID=UPI003F7F26F9